MARKKARKSKKSRAKTKTGKARKADYFPKGFKSTADVKVSKRLADQVIGQDASVKVIKKASKQKRNVLLVGTPGTGKSMLAQAMSELLPVQKLEDLLVYANQENENAPKVRTLKAGEGKKLVDKERIKTKMPGGNMNLVIMIFVMVASFLLLAYWRPELGDVITAALLICLFIVAGMLAVGSQLGRGRMFDALGEPSKLLVDNAGKKNAPFVDATGARAGALLGDVRHDPFQSSIDEVRLWVSWNRGEKELSFEEFWKWAAKKHPDLIERREDGYEAIVLPESEEVYTRGWSDSGEVTKTRIRIVNRRPFEGEVVSVKCGDDELTTTPEHLFITKHGSKRADELTPEDSLWTRARKAFTKITAVG